MNLEQLDGFLAALICGSEIVRPSEYLPVICGSDIVSTQSVLQDFLSLIRRHWNVIADTLHSGNVFLPLLLEDESGISHANDWAKGFSVSWTSCAEQTGLFSWMTKSTVAGSCRFLLWRTKNNPDPEMRPCKRAISAEERDKLIVGAAAG